MKINLTLNIKRKTLLFVGLIVVFSFVITLSWLRYRSNQANIKISTDMIKESANRYALYVKEEMEESMEVARVLGAVIQEMIESEQNNRTFVNRILKKTLEKSPNLLGIWIVFEKNAFDGKDADYVNTFGHDKTGQFVPFFYRADGEIKQEETSNIDHINQPYYNIPKMTKMEAIITPYLYPINGKMVMMVSCVVPILINGEVKGVVGVDIMPDLLQNKIADITLFENGFAALLDQDFTLIAHKYPERIGKKLLDKNLEHSAQKNIRAGKIYEGFTISQSYNQQVYRIFVPFWIGNTQTPWALVLNVPMNELLKTSNEISNFILVSSLVMILLILLSLNFLSDQIITPIVQLVDSLHELAKGKISNDNKLNIRSNDELGLMSKALNNVIESLGKSANFAKKIGEGDLNTPFEPSSEEDVLGNSLLKMRESLQKSEKETQIRQWTNEGISIFSEILRSNTDLNLLYDHFLASLVKYMNANQAGLFIHQITQYEEQELELMSCYAYERKRFLEKKVNIDEGLLGQCFQEKSVVFITEIPDSYIHIRSGLGGTNPKSLLLVPIKINDKVLGVIELASFEVFEKYQMDWLEKVAENLASVITVSKNNLRTQILLEESQIQAEELRMKEEEMRQNLEELSATQDKQKDLEEKLKEKIAMLSK
ncbi:MAG: HAMP domain-containing protein [Bacteroidetes bacterium]|nr:MAG: HAMP domain-containing protein [Bacteroidota bacterium]